jgi:hypothetical protein
MVDGEVDLERNDQLRADEQFSAPESLTEVRRQSVADGRSPEPSPPLTSGCSGTSASLTVSEVGESIPIAQ